MNCPLPGKNSLDSILDDNVGIIRQSVAGALLHNALQGGRAGAAQSVQQSG